MYKNYSDGYFVTLLFFWLNSPELAVERLKSRVNAGGHNIPTDVIYRRYYAGLVNLSKRYLPICDYWLLIDNLQTPFQLIAEGNKAITINVHNTEIFTKITSQ